MRSKKKGKRPNNNQPSHLPDIEEAEIEKAIEDSLRGMSFGKLIASYKQKPNITPEEIHNLAAQIGEQIAITMQQYSDNVLRHILLTEDGDLIDRSDSSRVYQMGKNGMRLAIINILIQKDGKPILPADLAKAAGYKTESDSLRKAINEINLLFKTHFRLPNDEAYNLITSKGGNGYRINPIYQIHQ